MYERVLAIQEKALGKDHPETASTLCDLASVLNRNGDDDLTPTVTATLLLPPEFLPPEFQLEQSFQ